MVIVRQGDILVIERISKPVLVLSKNFFNESGEIIGCPIYTDVTQSTRSPLHVKVEAKEMSGVVQCEKMTLLDLHVRGYHKVGEINLSDRMEISDIVRGIFDYV